MNKELEEEYKSVVLRNQQEMEEMKRGFEERLLEAQQSTVYIYTCTSFLNCPSWIPTSTFVLTIIDEVI